MPSPLSPQPPFANSASNPVSLTIRFARPDGLASTVVVESGRALVLGRDLGCDVRLDGRKVSRRHLRIENRASGDVVVVDNDSHNGTFINGQRVTEAALCDGDLVQAGEWEGRAELRASHASGGQRPPGMPRVMAAVMPAVSVEMSKDSTGSVSQRVQLSDGFEGITDPEGRAQPRLSAPAGVAATQSRAMAAGSGTGTTRVIALADLPPLPKGTWNWDDAQPSADGLRSAKVEDNPMVRRISESQVNLDFRGLSELSQGLSDDGTGLRPVSPQAIDGILLRLVFKVTEALAQAESMDQFLQEMCESLQTAARAKGVIVLLPDDNAALQPRVIKLRRPDEKVELSRTVIEHAVQSKSALTTEDASADERFARGESVLRFDLKAVLCAPLVKDDIVVGALYITRDLPFSNTERDLVAALGQLIAMGLERSRLREEYAAAERTKKSLERFHAPDVVRRLMMESSAPASARGDGLFLEPLTATVLFCDLAGFTAWCEAHDAETVGRVLNMYLGTMTEHVFKYGGTVDKFIGDAVMCIFGAPFMADDDALRAVQCAISMRAAFRQLVASGAVGEDAKTLDVHIGVNTGRVVAGTVGSAQRMEYTALGDTVNIAARLEGVAKAGMIVLGPTTAALVSSTIGVRSLGRVSLKGKAEAIEAFEVPEDAA